MIIIISLHVYTIEMVCRWQCAVFHRWPCATSSAGYPDPVGVCGSNTRHSRHSPEEDTSGKYSRLKYSGSQIKVPILFL